MIWKKRQFIGTDSLGRKLKAKDAAKNRITVKSSQSNTLSERFQVFRESNTLIKEGEKGREELTLFFFMNPAKHPSTTSHKNQKENWRNWSKNLSNRSGEMVPWLRVHTALAEDPSRFPIPIHYQVSHTTGNSSSRGTDTSGFLTYLHSRAQVQAHRHIHIKNLSYVTIKNPEIGSCFQILTSKPAYLPKY